MKRFKIVGLFSERTRSVMRKLAWMVFPAAAGALIWAADWPSSSGNPQRDAWSRGEKALSKESVAAKKIELLYKYKFDNQTKGLNALTQPIILSNLIGYKGFKELLFIGGSSEVVYSIDADLGKPYFKTQLDLIEKPGSGESSVVCSGGLTADVAMAGSSAAGRRGGGPPPPVPGAARGATPGAPAAAPGQAPPAAGAPDAGRGGRGGFGRGPAIFWAITSDGYLRTLRQEDGDAKWIAPVKFIPSGARVSGLNVNADVIYASTVYGCGGNPNGLYAALLTPPQMPRMPGEPLVKPAEFKVTSLLTNGSGFSGSGGTAIGEDGTVYGQIAEGNGAAAGTYSDTVVALDPKELTVKDYFTPEGSRPPLKKGLEAPGVTPVVFQWNGKAVVVAGGRDGRLYVLDSASLGGADHHTPLSQTEPVVAPDMQYAGSGIWGAFATWEDEAHNNERWLYASIRGSASASFPTTNGAAAAGAIVAFKVEDRGGKPQLSPQWISHDLLSPAAPATANGLVFALSTGLSPRVAKADGSPYTLAEFGRMAKPATLYVLDGGTGRELFSSGNTATAYAHSGIAVANSRVYFSTHDNTLFVYGIPMEH
jgi:outer membrane protein assembly factor BamB